MGIKNGHEILVELVEKTAAIVHLSKQQELHKEGQEHSFLIIFHAAMVLWIWGLQKSHKIKQCLSSEISGHFLLAIISPTLNSISAIRTESLHNSDFLSVCVCVCVCGALDMK